MVSEGDSDVGLQVVWKATLTRLNGEQLAGSTDTIASNTMNIIVDKALVLGEPLQVQVVSKCSGRLCYFTLAGVVVYNRDLHGGMGFAIGLRLLEPCQAYTDFLQSISSPAIARIAC